MTCASPFGMASFQSSLVSGDQLRMRHATASSQQQATSFTPANTSSHSQQGPQALSTGLLRQFSACGLDSCTRERIRQQEQMASQQAAAEQQQCSQGTDCLGLQSQSSLLSQHAPPTKVPAFACRASAFPAPRRLELSQNLSQEFLSTPDLSTPQDQQFHVAYDPCASSAMAADEASRSPAPSPQRLQKRPRSLAEDSESMSQPSQSQSRSQGEPSTCSKASGLRAGKPPMHPGGRSCVSHRVLRHGPPVIRNPYLTPGDGDDHVFHPPSGQGCSRADVLPPKQNRLTWDYKQENVLGNGNFSTVYRVTHRMSGKQYAIKKSRKSAVSVADKNMWLAEVQALAAVEGHPNVVTYYDSWTEPAEHNQGEHFFIKLELCGESLCKLSTQQHQQQQQLQQQQQQQQLGSSGSVTTGPSSGQNSGANGPCPIAIEPAGSTSSATCLNSGPSQHRTSNQPPQHSMPGCPPTQPSTAGGGGTARSQPGGRVAMKESDLLEVLRQMASALQHIHSLGLAHLDLKPDNIYRARPAVDSAASAPSWSGFRVHKDAQPNGVASSSPFGAAAGVPASAPPPPQPEVYKLGDFGLCTAKDGSGRVVEGDARYLAPELLNGKYTEVGLDKADLFALGATLYELATGTGLPASGERFHALRQGQLMMMPHVSMKLQSLIKRLMSHDPRARPTAEQVLRSPLLQPPPSPQHQQQQAPLQSSGSFAMAISP